MTRYGVQFELPVDNPVMNVGVMRGQNGPIFFVPINYPDAHNLGYWQLEAAVKLSGRLVLSTHLNRKRSLKKE